MSYPLCVCVCIVKDGCVLSSSRRHDPDAWGLPGGKVYDAIRRKGASTPPG